MNDKQLLAEALASLEKLKENGQFFISAIELDYDLDGEEYEQEVQALIEKIKASLDTKD